MKTNARILMISGMFTAWFLTLVPTLRAQVATNLAPAYTIVDLRVLPGGLDDSYATAVNNAGQVVGQSSSANNTGGAYDGFIWDTINGMRDVGKITGDATWLTGINNQGVAVGYSGDSYWGWFQAVRWDSVNGIQALGFGAIAGYPYYGAFAINDGGSITYLNWSFSGPPSKAYLLSGGTATWIGELYSDAYMWPAAINNNNEIAGGCAQCAYCDGIEQAFLWTSAQGMNGLGFLQGYANSIARSINDAGQVVGYCNNADGTQAAFIWTAGAGMSQLGFSGIGGSNYMASAISAGGIVAGNCVIAGTEHAVAWAPGQNAVDLNTLVTNMNGWSVIQTATGINSSGIIVGSGLLTNGDTHACILYPAVAPVTVNIKMFAGIIINNAPIGSNYLIQATSNLASTNWTTLTNVAIPTQPYIYIDYSSYTNSQQFYRVVPQ